MGTSASVDVVDWLGEGGAGEVGKHLAVLKEWIEPEFSLI